MSSMKNAGFVHGVAASGSTMTNRCLHSGRQHWAARQSVGDYSAHQSASAFRTVKSIRLHSASSSWKDRTSANGKQAEHDNGMKPISPRVPSSAHCLAGLNLGKIYFPITFVCLLICLWPLHLKHLGAVGGVAVVKNLLAGGGKRITNSAIHVTVTLHPAAP